MEKLSRIQVNALRAKATSVVGLLAITIVGTCIITVQQFDHEFIVTVHQMADGVDVSALDYTELAVEIGDFQYAESHDNIADAFKSMYGMVTDTMCI